MKTRIGLLVLLAALMPPAAAEDLLQVYRDAQRYDAVYSGARNSLVAGREKLPQGRALVLPSLNLTGNVTRQALESDSHNPTATPSFTRYPHVYGYQLTFTQPVFRLQNWNQYGQAEFQVKQAEATFGQAGQDLMLRAAQAYFDVLAAQDSLGLVRAQKAAISEQLAQAKRNFEVGTATITDTHEAQARSDLSAAQEIAALNDLENRRAALRLLTGKEYAVLKPLRPDIKLSQPNPNDEQAWVELATRQSYAVQVQEAGTAIAALEAKRNSNAHLPTLDFVASYGQTDQSQGTTLTQSIGSTITQTQIGVQLAMPLINGIAQVGALEQARISSQSALDSNKLGYEVGVRINIDVLNAQQQLYSTERDLAVARYNTITNHLKLKAAAGSLVEQDLEEVNRALAP